MSFIHNWPCQDCGQVINGPHSNLPGIEVRRRADELRAGGILKNDSPPYVRLGTLEPRRTKRESYMEYFIHENE